MDGILSSEAFSASSEPPLLSEPPPSSSPSQAVPEIRKEGWSKVARKSSQSIAPYELKLNFKDGVVSAPIPDDLFVDAAPLWYNLVIGHFIGDAPHIGSVHATVNRIWKNPRNPLLVRAWSPETASESPIVKSLPMWVDFKDVPTHLFTLKGLSFLASHVGDPIKLHPKTESCLRLDVARLLISVNLERELPGKISVPEGNFPAAIIPVSFPWTPPRCTKCCKWGHANGDCLNHPKVGETSIIQHTATHVVIPTPLPETGTTSLPLPENVNQSDTSTAIALSVKEYQIVASTVPPHSSDAIQGEALVLSGKEKSEASEEGTDISVLTYKKKKKKRQDIEIQAPPETELAEWTSVPKIGRSTPVLHASQSNVLKVTSSRFKALAHVREEGEIEEVSDTEQEAKTQSKEGKKMAKSQPGRAKDQCSANVQNAARKASFRKQ